MTENTGLKGYMVKGLYGYMVTGLNGYRAKWIDGHIIYCCDIMTFTD